MVLPLRAVEGTGQAIRCTMNNSDFKKNDFLSLTIF